MNIRYFSLSMVLCAALAGCATKGILGNHEEDVGPLPPDWESQIRYRLSVTLKDPYSADVEIGIPYMHSCARGIYGTFHGWMVPVIVNAKNSYGAYTGDRWSYAWFAGGRLVRESGSPDLCPT